jgi:hypothetical protein
MGFPVAGETDVVRICLGKRRISMYWYNPKTRVSETVAAPGTDEEAREMLRGYRNSCAFLTEYDKLRADGMPVEQATIFVGHHFRMRHLESQPDL